MKLLKLKLKNIRSYKNEEIEFPQGSLLLSGDVGAGKTTLLLAIEFALFGLQPGQKASSLLRNSCSSGEVELCLEIEGKEVIIERKIKREPKKSIISDYSAITVDGQKLEYSVTELKTAIIKLLGYPAEFIKKNNILYRYTVYTPQEQMKQIILEDAETRINILRHIFGMDKYKRIRENLAVFINNLREESKFLQGAIKSLDEEKTKKQNSELTLVQCTTSIGEKEKVFLERITIRKEIEEECIELEEKVKEKENFEKEIEKTKIFISTKREQLSNLIMEEEDLSRKIAPYKEGLNLPNITEIEENLKKNKTLLEELNSKYIFSAAKINSLSSSIQENMSKRERIFRIEICPTCLQDVSETHKHNIKNETEKEISNTNRTLQQYQLEKENFEKEIEKIKSLIISLDKNKHEIDILKSKQVYLQEAKTKLDQVRKSKENLDKDVIFLTNHLSSLKEYSLSFSKFSNLLKIKREELKAALLTEKNAEIALAETNKEIQLIRRSIKELEEEIMKKELTKVKLTEISEVIDWLSTGFVGMVDFTERSVMVKLREDFSKTLSKWFQLLAGESFEIQLDEKFTPIILQGEVEMDYSFLSGGERTAVALAYRLALNQTINSVLSKINTRDLVILDEPTDGFSEAQIEKVRDILSELNVKQLILVSHEQKIESFVDNVIKVKKEQDSSFIEQPDQPEV